MRREMSYLRNQSVHATDRREIGVTPANVIDYIGLGGGPDLAETVTENFVIETLSVRNKRVVFSLHSDGEYRDLSEPVSRALTVATGREWTAEFIPF